MTMHPTDRYKMQLPLLPLLSPSFPFTPGMAPDANIPRATTSSPDDPDPSYRPITKIRGKRLVDDTDILYNVVFLDRADKWLPITAFSRYIQTPRANTLADTPNSGYYCMCILLFYLLYPSWVCFSPLIILFPTSGPQHTDPKMLRVSLLIGEYLLRRMLLLTVGRRFSFFFSKPLPLLKVLFLFILPLGFFKIHPTFSGQHGVYMFVCLLFIFTHHHNYLFPQRYSSSHISLLLEHYIVYSYAIHETEETCY